MVERKQELRVLGYGRVSTRGQFLRGTSVEHQKSSIQKECEKESFKLVDFISDDGVSGKTIKDRPAIQKVEELARAKKFDCLMFTKLDRVGRSVRELENFWKLMEKDLALRLYCIDQPIISKSKFGKMMRQLLSIFAEFERDLIIERTTENRLANWQDGKVRGVGKLPYGYDWDPVKKCIIEDPERGPYYKKIVSLYLDEHYCYDDIANWLTDRAIEPVLAKSKRWNGTTVGNILKNPAYTGEPVTYNQHNKAGDLKPEAEWVEKTYPALISKNRWQQIRRRIQFNKGKSKKKHYEGYERFIANEVLYCFECGARVRKRLKGNGAFYICDNKRRSEKELKLKGRNRCILKGILADKADEKIFLDIADLLSDPSAYAKDWLKDADLAEIEDRIKRLTVEIKKSENAIARNTKELWPLKGPAREEMISLIKKATKEFESLNNRRSEAEAEKSFYDNKVDVLAEYQKNLSELSLPLKGQIIKYLFSLPYKDRQRILEAIVSPESGGKIYVRYQRAGDLINYGDDIKYKSEDLAKPLIDREPVLEPDYKADLSKIIALISSLKNKDLLNVINLY